MRCAMPPTTPERYAVVSCHVERPLDDHVWAAFAALQERRPGGLAVAALLRPPDPEAGEHDAETWVRRAHEAAVRAPLGHHTHFTSPTHARPSGGDPGERVRREAAWLVEHGVSTTLFCGGGWYTDVDVAEACAALGYVDCTGRADVPPYLEDAAAWVQLAAPARVRLPSGALLPCLPTTRSLGSLARALWGRGELREPVVHVYFHDTDLLDRRRRILLRIVLTALSRRRRTASAVDAAATITGAAVDWADVARGRPVGN
jgi:hypothetical protein